MPLLGLQGPAHQCSHGLPWWKVFVKNPVEFETNRHIDTHAIRDLADGSCSKHAFDDLLYVLLRLLDSLTGGKRQSHSPIAGQVVGAGQDEITHTCETHEGILLRAERESQPRHLDQTASDQCNSRVSAEAQAIRQPGGDSQVFALRHRRLRWR